MSMWHIWLIVSGIFLVIEAATVGFLFFWFAVGALIALIASFFISNVIVQCYIFVISSTLLILFTKPLVQKIKSNPTVKTNVFSVIDKSGIVTIDIDPIEGTGQVKINNGDVWSAVSANGETISKGTEIVVEKIEGVKLLVKPSKVTSVIN